MLSAKSDIKHGRVSASSDNVPIKDAIMEYKYVRIEGLRNVVKKTVIYWDTLPCSPLKVSRRFGGICRLYLQSGKINKERS
jgi:hypothetical protein